MKYNTSPTCYVLYFMISSQLILSLSFLLCILSPFQFSFSIDHNCSTKEGRPVLPQKMRVLKLAVDHSAPHWTPMDMGVSDDIQLFNGSPVSKLMILLITKIQDKQTYLHLLLMLFVSLELAVADPAFKIVNNTCCDVSVQILKANQVSPGTGSLAAVVFTS